MNEIYIIMWRGRDVETGVWDDYPCFSQGYYTDYNTAQAVVDELNNTDPREYDAEADDMETYVVQVIHPAKKGD